MGYLLAGTRVGPHTPGFVADASLAEQLAEIGGLIFGMALSVASTVVHNNDLHTQAGHIAVGWLVVEDLFTVLALVLLPALFSSTNPQTPLWAALGWTAIKVSGLVAFTAFVGTRLIPNS